MIRSRLRDVWRAMRCWPDRAGWLRAGRELGWAVPLLLLTAYVGGLIEPTGPSNVQRLAVLAVSLLIFPALGEELLFRALLISRERPGRWALAISTLLFVLWHPLQVVTIGPPWARTFLDPWFLACTGLLGFALARIYAATGSIWPCVAAHWLVVFCWKALLGGPF
jgi:uncharacterized protein